MDTFMNFAECGGAVVASFSVALLTAKVCLRGLFRMMSRS